jgi:hypothetical protein
MKRQSQVVKARELRAAQATMRWLASGCNWAPSPKVEETKRWAKAQLGSVSGMLAFYRLALSLSDGYITQSTVGAAHAALAHNDWAWARSGEAVYEE